SPISGSQSLQMRLYSNGNFGYSQTNFDLANVSKVTFDARWNSSSVNVKVEYSVNSGVSWLGGQTFTLSNTASSYQYVVSSTGEYANVRLKFSLVGTAPTSSNKQLIIDNVAVYGITAPSCITATTSFDGGNIINKTTADA